MAKGKYHYYTDGGVFLRECYDFRIAKKEAKKLAAERKINAYLYTHYPSGKQDLYTVLPTGEIISNGTMAPLNN